MWLEVHNRWVIKGRLLQVTSPDLFGQAREVEGGVPVSSLTTHSGRRVLWQCSQGHKCWATVASRSAGSGCSRCSVPGRSLFEEEVAELLRVATRVQVLTDVSVRVGKRKGRIDLKVVTPTPLLVDLDPAPWHAREGSANEISGSWRRERHPTTSVCDRTDFRYWSVASGTSVIARGRTRAKGQQQSVMMSCRPAAPGGLFQTRTAPMLVGVPSTTGSA